MSIDKQTANLKKIFEKELKAKLSTKSNHKTSEELLLLKTCKYFDLMGSGGLEIHDFKKALDKLGVSGFSDDNLTAIFNVYADKSSKQIDYKSFSKGLYSNANIKDKIEEIEYIIKKLRKEILTKGFGALSNLIRELQKLAFESSVGIIPTQLEKLNEYYKLNLKADEIERIYFAFYDINTFNHREFLATVIPELGVAQKDFFINCFGVLNQTHGGSLSVNDLVEAYKPEFAPQLQELNDKDLKSAKEKKQLEFNEALKTITAMSLSKLNDIKLNINSDMVLNESLFLGFFKIYSFFIESEDELFETILEVFQIKQRQDRIQKNKFNTNEDKRQKKVAQDKLKEDGINLGSKDDDIPNLNRQQQKTLENLKTKLLKMNKKFFVELNRQFIQLDVNNSKTLDFDNFTKAIKLTNVSFFKNEVSQIFAMFEKKEKGTINFEQFTKAMVNMNYRAKLISRVFSKLESESITKNQLSSFYIIGKLDAKNHPEVLNGNIDAEEAIEEFKSSLYQNFGVKNSQADFDINRNDFIHFYLCYSAGVQNDQLFEATLNNIWHLSDEVYEFEENKYNDSDKNRNANKTLKEKFEDKFHNEGATPYGMDKKANPYQDVIPVKKIKKQSNELLKFIKALRKRGTRGIMSLRRSFDVADSNGNGVVDFEEFNNLLNTLRISLNTQEVKLLFEEFDSNHNGEIDYDEFITAIVGEMVEERISRIKQLFYILDKNKSGTISVEELKDGYCYKRHPDVLKGKRTPEEVFAEFLDNVDYHFKLLKNNSNAEEMTLEHFIDFYKNISFIYEKNNDFDDILKAVWGMNN